MASEHLKSCKFLLLTSLFKGQLTWSWNLRSLTQMSQMICPHPVANKCLPGLFRMVMKLVIHFGHFLESMDLVLTWTAVLPYSVPDVLESWISSKRKFDLKNLNENSLFTYVKFPFTDRILTINFRVNITLKLGNFVAEKINEINLIYVVKM